MIGNTVFWMDTLTVNQRDQAETISTVQAIPSIFRDALKTIAVREGDGLFDCCGVAVKDFQNWEELAQILSDHVSRHFKDMFEESYLQRL